MSFSFHSFVFLQKIRTLCLHYPQCNPIAKVAQVPGNVAPHNSLIEDSERSSDAEPCHLARVHSDVPGAGLAVVIAVGIVPAAEGAGL